MDARSKAWVCGRSLTGVAGSNPAGVVEFCLVSIVCWQVEIGRSLIERSPAEFVCVCVCVAECDAVQQSPCTLTMSR